jgi:hypothetical protein
MPVRVPRSFKMFAVWSLVALLALNTAVAGRGRLFGRHKCRPVCCPPPKCAPACPPKCAPACATTTIQPELLPPQQQSPSGVSPNNFNSAPEAPLPPSPPQPPSAPVPADEAPSLPATPAQETPVAPAPLRPMRPMPKAPPAPPADEDLFGEPTPPKKPAAAEEEVPVPAKPAAPKADSDDLFNSVFSEPPAKPVSQPVEEMPLPAPKKKPEPKPADDNDPFADNIALATPAMRDWVDDTGAYRIRARLVQVLDGKVKLLKDTGKTTTVPFSRLSGEDLKYVEKFQSQARQGRPTPLAAR